MIGIEKLVREISWNTGLRVSTVFDDWIAMYSLSLRNATSLKNEAWEQREQLYLDIINKHPKSEHLKIKALCDELIDALSNELTDVLGPIYMSMGMGNEDLGQFFTPREVSRLMAISQIDKHSLKQAIDDKGFASINDPSSGSGATLIEGIIRVKELGFNPQKQLLVVAEDLSLSAVQMCYVQLSLLGIPAIIKHQNTLTLNVYDVYYTPMYIMDGWDFKLRANRFKGALDMLTMEPDTEPIRYTEPLEQPEPEFEIQLGLF